jgi:hypothetical protein
MSQDTHNILKKINYIEADIEIHKQILFSIPSDNRQEIENTLQTIAGKKEKITQLRDEIQRIDPEWFKQITVFEKAINDFKKIAVEKNFLSIVSKNIGEQCTLSLANMAEVECLIKACDENENWTIITPEGEIHYFEKNEVSEKPEQESASK